MIVENHEEICPVPRHAREDADQRMVEGQDLRHPTPSLPGSRRPSLSG